MSGPQSEHARLAKAEISRILWNLAVAATHGLVLLCMLGIHGLVSHFLGFVIPEDWVKLKIFFEASFSAGFIVVYIKQVYDMIVIFIPSLKYKQKSADTRDAGK